LVADITNAASSAGDTTIDGALNPAMLVPAGLTQVLSKFKKNCNRFPFDGHDRRVNAPNPGVSEVFASTFTLRDVK